jgi:hypothetical protein
MLISLMMAIFAAPAMADGSAVENPNHPDYWEAFLADEGFADAECVKIEGESQTNFEADADYTLVVVKKGSGENAQALHWNVTAGAELEPNQDGKPENASEWVGYSYVITCVAADAEAEADLDLAEVSVTGACEDDEFVLSVSTVNASVDVDLNADGNIEGENEIDVADGDHVIEASGEIDWEATADVDAEFAGGLTVDSGTVTILDCEDEDVGGIITDLAEVSVTGACEAGAFVLTVLTVNASVDVDLNADGNIEGENEIDVADGDHVIEASGEIDWEATADVDAEFADEATVSGTVSILDCEDEGALTLMVEKSATQSDVALNATTAATSNEAITFMVTITNTSDEEIGITSLDDDVFGSLSGDADCQVGTTLAIDASCSFTFVKTLNIDLTAEQLAVMVDTESHTNLVTVMGEGIESEADVSAEATLTFAVIPTEVAGIVVTAPEQEAPVVPIQESADVLATQVDAEQLPFTGMETGHLIGLAMLLLGGGALLLRGAPEAEEN